MFDLPRRAFVLARGSFHRRSSAMPNQKWT
jgi:hypothetical protein